MTSLHEVALHLFHEDEVAVAKTDLVPGTILTWICDDQEGVRLEVCQSIPTGHKIALRTIHAGEPVHKYGHVIGFAARTIGAGQHVHDHNLEARTSVKVHAIGSAVMPVSYVPRAQRRLFQGFRRPDGRVGTRNLIAVVSSVHCSAHACRRIARHFTPECLAPYPNVDGVIAVTHTGGCGEHPGYEILQRTLGGVARHPNVGAYLLVGLGCEGNQIAALAANQGLVDQGARTTSGHPLAFSVQDSGGLGRAVEVGIRAVEELLPEVNAAQRTPQPISGLTLALQCGGSDGWSGITANPLVGLVVDQIVAQGGTAVLSETPEVFGAEHLLTRRAASAKVGQDLVDKLRWWEAYVDRQGLELDHNAGPGNRAGGISNIYEKSLGAIAKGGSTPLVAVYDYAQPVDQRGLVFMDGPGFDPISVTGMLAGGCNLVLFTTGRGSVSGHEIAPSIKICSNSSTYQRMVDDMDFDAGRVLLPGVDMRAVASELLSLVVSVASGQESKSEQQQVGEGEFIPWNPEGVT